MGSSVTSTARSCCAGRSASRCATSEPDFYVRARRALRVDPSHSIALEDSARGVPVAHRGELTVIAVFAGLSMHRSPSSPSRACTMRGCSSCSESTRYPRTAPRERSDGSSPPRCATTCGSTVLRFHSGGGDRRQLEQRLSGGRRIKSSDADSMLGGELYDVPCRHELREVGAGAQRAIANHRGRERSDEDSDDGARVE